MSQLKVNSVVDASGGNTATINSMTPTADSLQGFRNRIINGDMRIDQRNAGAAVTTSSSFPVDRFSQAFSNASCSFQQITDAPAGFINSLRLTVTTGSAPSAGTNNVILQRIEGLNLTDFGLGTANAVTFTLSFWVKGSVTGTYAVSFTNSAFNRSYVSTYTISSANTWEQKTITVTGDTSGTWLTTNGTGLVVLWDFGSGTNLNTTAGSWQAGNFYRTSACTTIASTTNATLQITGVQLEKGSTATPFERRPYGTELMLCQRYFQTWGGTNGNEYAPWNGLGYNSTTAEGCFIFICPMRSAPSLTQIGNWLFNDIASDNAAGTLGIGATGLQTTQMRSATATGITQYRPYTLRASNTTSRIQLSAEL